MDIADVVFAQGGLALRVGGLDLALEGEKMEEQSFGGKTWDGASLHEAADWINRKVVDSVAELGCEECSFWENT